MRRRQFLGLTAAAGVCSGLSAAAPAARKPARMKVGCQRGPTTPGMLQFFKRHGVEEVVGYPKLREGQTAWTADDLRRLQDLCGKHGIRLGMVALPFLTSSHIDRERRGAILLGKEPGRSRDIDAIHKMIAACGKAGVPAFKYNLSLLGVLRTAATPGRGGSRYASWKLAEAKPAAPLTRAGKVSAELFWERISHFLGRVIPVCEEYRVRAACHPHDPGVPRGGYQGIDNVLGTPEGLDKLLSIRRSPYHGLNFCVGSLAEMLRRPGEQAVPWVRHFARQKKVFLVHLRNIRGRRDDFREVYPDEGDVNLVAVLRELQAAGYDGMVAPDHMPFHPDDPQRLQAFAFGYGYIKGVLQAL
jgi:mannonate dehydratase